MVTKKFLKAKFDCISISVHRIFFFSFIFIFIFSFSFIFFKYETIVSRNGLSLGYSERDISSVNWSIVYFCSELFTSVSSVETLNNIYCTLSLYAQPLIHCNAEQGRKGNKQGNLVMKTGLSCNYYRIFPVTGKNSKAYRIKAGCFYHRISLLHSSLFYPVYLYQPL